MKFINVLLLICVFFSVYACMLHKTNRQNLHELARTPMLPVDTDEFISIPKSKQQPGDAAAGLKYLTTGDYISSGLPAGLYNWTMRDEKKSFYEALGYNKNTLINFNVFTNAEGMKLAAPGCLQCHATLFDNQMIIGLGNSFGYYTTNSLAGLQVADKALKTIYGKNSKQYKAAEQLFKGGQIIAPKIVTEAKGVNPAERIAEVIAMHRDPTTLAWDQNKNYFEAQKAVVPTDVPAWWLLKKKNAMYYNANARGNFARQLMAASILTLNDTVTANVIHTKMKDVLGFIYQIQAPKYPKPINEQLAESGKALFNDNCARCHGTYGDKPSYPNVVVAIPTIGTDSLMAKQYLVQDGYVKWYNSSWFNKGAERSWMQPEYGYVAPPLDGVWITAPYFHNGSVPDIESVLNSKNRPAYWLRNFNRGSYDYEKLGWTYNVKARPHGNNIYNTSLPGYGNYGHTFGDLLTSNERKSVIEYLKTL